MLERTILSPEFWKHASIPFVAALVGWATNWVAIKLTFRPLEFVGVAPYLGWQGIIPRKAGKMARIFVDKTMFRLGSLEELFLSMEPKTIAKHVSGLLDGRLEAYTDEVMFYGSPGVWSKVPQVVRDSVHARVRERMPQFVDALVQDIAENIENLVDFKEMLVVTLEADRDLLNRLFLEAGEAEFRFIVRSGLYFGFLFGLVQLLVWTLLKSWWVLPAFGLFVGAATNWFAINIVFRPLNPVRVGPWTVQGLFLKRQKEVAAVWTRLVTTEIVTLQRIVYTLLYGSRSNRARAMIRAHIQPIADEVMRGYAPLSDLAIASEARERIRKNVGDKAVEVSTDPFDHWPFNRERGRLAEGLLRERMAGLSSSEFQDLLRPCFQEDEIKLIVVGGLLGLLAGVAQLVFVFGGGV